MTARPAAPLFYRDLRLGILGGGQLGRMLLVPARRLQVHTAVLDPDADAPARPAADRFVQGSFRDPDTVLAFAQGLDVLTVEIEHVHTGALRQLRDQGVRVYPSPEVLETVQDKGRQKQFYAAHNLPTAPFQLIDDPATLTPDTLTYPQVLKLRTGGYDGRGVHILRSPDDLRNTPFRGPCVLEQAVDIRLELAVLVARNPQGEVAVYPPVEMVFHPTANLVEFLLGPADIPASVAAQAQAIAQTLVTALDHVGLLAVEFFWDTAGRLLINEIAPRPHNSGHHTIEACATSQFEQHLRAVLGLPLGSPAQHVPAAMLNLLGAEGHAGPPIYEGLSQVLATPGGHVHLYGKAETRPLRKMGHITLTDPDVARLRDTARRLQAQLRVIT